MARYLVGTLECIATRARKEAMEPVVSKKLCKAKAGKPPPFADWLESVLETQGRKARL